MGTATRARGRGRSQIGKSGQYPLRADRAQPERAHPRGVDDPAPTGHRQGDGRGRGVPASSGDRVDRANCLGGIRYQPVDQR